ncbi:MAG: glycosyltransferase family 9 protein, partial [Leptospiraceae bacterium]|nr:glycosyltransferase family 9 protein [Leptospiraceae bacterium]
TSLLAMFSRIPKRYGYGSAGFARLAYTHRLRRNTQRIEIDRLLDFLADALRVNTAECPRDLKIFVNDSARQEARQLLRDLDVRRPILLGPSSVWPTKRWTAWGFARLANDLIRRYRSPVLLVGAPGDREINDRVQRWVRLLYPPYIQERVFNVAGRTSLPGLYALMEQSLLLVSNDSAPVHFGCAAGLPLVSIFGPTAPSLGYAPVAPRTAVAELSDLHCRPCSTHGGRDCPQQHFRCMRDLEPEMILRHLERLVST